VVDLKSFSDLCIVSFFNLPKHNVAMKLTGLLVCVCIGFTTMQAFAITDYLTENDIQYCEENYEQYKLIGDYEFLERERHTIEARVCVYLYNDPVWSDASKYRAAKLLERGNYYVNVEIEQSKANAESGTIPQKEKPLTDLQKAINQITALEKKVAYLEKKDCTKRCGNNGASQGYLGSCKQDKICSICSDSVV
jgi:hypothetical protein